MRHSFGLSFLLFVLPMVSCSNGDQKSLLVSSNGFYWQDTDQSSPTYKRVYVFNGDGSCKLYEYNTAAGAYLEYTVDDIKTSNSWSMQGDSLKFKGSTYHIDQLTSESLVITNASGVKKTLVKTSVNLK